MSWWNLMSQKELHLLSHHYHWWASAQGKETFYLGDFDFGEGSFAVEKSLQWDTHVLQAQHSTQIPTYWMSDSGTLTRDCARMTMMNALCTLGMVFHSNTEEAKRGTAFTEKEDDRSLLMNKLSENKMIAGFGLHFQNLGILTESSGHTLAYMGLEN